MKSNSRPCAPSFFLVALPPVRTVCRRAERRAVPLEGVEAVVITYLNRLSDLLFVIARAVNHRKGIPETEW